MAGSCRSATLRGQYGVVLAVGRHAEQSAHARMHTCTHAHKHIRTYFSYGVALAASRQVEVRMQGGGEDEEDDMFSTNRKFNPNDLAYAGTVRAVQPHERSATPPSSSSPPPPPPPPPPAPTLL